MSDEKMIDFFRIIIKQTENKELQWKRVKNHTIENEYSFQSNLKSQKQIIRISFVNKEKTKYLIQLHTDLDRYNSSDIQSTLIDVNSKVGEIINELWNLLDNKYPPNNSFSFEELVDEYINAYRLND